jgi:hypothetical protein
VQGIDASQACDGSACGLTVPPAWAVVAFGTGACAAGWSGSDVVEGVTAGAGACSCGACAVTAPPSCMTGTIPLKFDLMVVGSSCAFDGLYAYSASGGACTPVSGLMQDPGQHLLAQGPTPDGGSCDAGATPSRAAVTSTPGRVCVPPACTSACDGPGTGTKTCLLAAGDQPCPAGLSDRHVVGTDFALACGCACATTAAGCNGTVTLYADNGCATELAQLDAGTCTTTGMAVGSYKWSGSAAGVTCTNAAPAATASLLGVTTLCCR